MRALNIPQKLDSFKSGSQIQQTCRVTDMLTETTKMLGLNSAIKPADVRKNKKPLMERKRRERINTCLEELKKLVVDSSQKENGRYAKLEKADILEMTVKHLRGMQRLQKRDMTNRETSVETNFLTGFGECAREVTRYMTNIADLNNDVRNRVVRHLSTCIQNIQPPNQDTPTVQAIPSASQVNTLPGTFSNNNNTQLSHQSVSVPTIPHPTTTISTPVINNNINNNNGQTFVVATAAPLLTTTSCVGGNQFAVNAAQIGRIALVLPNGQTAGQIIPVYTNFTQVTPASDSTGPCKPHVVSNIVTNNDSSAHTTNITTSNVTDSSPVTDNQSAGSVMWRPW